MNDETNKAIEVATPAVPTIPARVQGACDVATGRTQPDDAETGTRVTGAKKDLNAKGRGPQWYRMVYRGGSWRYVSTDRLPNGAFLAADRRAEVYGEVFPGEIVVQHDRGSPVDAAWLVAAPNSEGKCMTKITFAKRRSGDLAFTLPDGSEVVLSDPRGRN